jgi:hypothetical protein
MGDTNYWLDIIKNAVVDTAESAKLGVSGTADEKTAAIQKRLIRDKRIAPPQIAQPVDFPGVIPEKYVPTPEDEKALPYVKQTVNFIKNMPSAQRLDFIKSHDAFINVLGAAQEAHDLVDPATQQLLQQGPQGE